MIINFGFFDLASNIILIFSSPRSIPEIDRDSSHNSLPSQHLAHQVGVDCGRSARDADLERQLAVKSSTNGQVGGARTVLLVDSDPVSP